MAEDDDWFKQIEAEVEREEREERKWGKSNGEETGMPQQPLVQTLDQFLASFVSPDPLIDGLMQRGFVYSLTGKTGAGKSAVALLAALLIADENSKKPFAGHEVEHGRVVYIAKENPIDIQMRLIAACYLQGIDPAIIGRNFLVVQSIVSIEKDWVRILAELKTFGDVALIIVDTSVALFTGEDENAGTAMYRHARKMRLLSSSTPGRPTVLTLCHPVKNPSNPEELLPRGGGPFLNEMDGNLTIWELGGGISVVHWTGKYRGPDFEKMMFRMDPTRTTQLRDRKGNMLSTVLARHVDDDEADAVEAKNRVQEQQVLVIMLNYSKGSLADWALKLGWMQTADPRSATPPKPNRNLVHRVMQRLSKEKAVRKEAGNWVLTDAGKKLAKKAAGQTDPTPEEKAA